MKKSLCSIIALFVVIVFVTTAFPQKRDYKPGDKIEYKVPGSYPEKWEEGTFVKASADGSQPIILDKPNQYFPQGLQVASQWNNIRPLIPKNPSVTAEDKQQVETKTKNVADSANVPEARNTGGTGLMTKEEMLGYMRMNGYANGQPKKDPRVCRDLIAEIKRRGVKEPLIYDKNIGPVTENGCSNTPDTDVIGASKLNLGPPTNLNWLSGTWLLKVIGGTVDTAPGDGYIYRKNESIAKVGFVTINGRGTYTWKVDPSDPPAKYVQGTWRKATNEEMGLQGGAGLVLQNAAEGADWIVFKYMNPYMQGDNVDVQHLQFRGSDRRIGQRK